MLEAASLSVTAARVTRVVVPARDARARVSEVLRVQLVLDVHRDVFVAFRANEVVTRPIDAASYVEDITDGKPLLECGSVEPVDGEQPL